MTFQSFHFVFFLLMVISLNHLLKPYFSARKNMLLLASYYFYMCWDWRFAGLLLINTALNFGVARRLSRAPSQFERRVWLSLSLAISLGALAYFKYANFFVENAVLFMRSIGFDATPTVLTLVLPLGISFFTFQSLSYVFDVYRGQQISTQDFRDFALFVAFFPTVLAGPITRGHQLLAQFSAEPRAEPVLAEDGLTLVVRGFVKKIVFADVLAAHLVDVAFANPSAHSPLYLLVALYAYSFQIYMDVSAYTDIARGAAAMCGFRLPENFDRPYLATSVSNFWQRWHMSMSGFFRDYVFFALGGSRHGYVYLNLMLTFVAIGMWHGGSWNFLLYGVLHGGMVCAERYTRRRDDKNGELSSQLSLVRRVFQVFAVFHFVVLTRVLFRSPDLSSAGQYVSAMLDFTKSSMPFDLIGALVFTACTLLHWVFPTAEDRTLTLVRRLPIAIRAGILVGVTYLCVALGTKQAAFIYFQF